MKFNCTLLVDDDSTSNMISERVLNKIQLTNTIQVTWNGREAIDYIHDSLNEDNEQGKPWPDLILLDINMPEMNGFEFLDEYLKVDTHGKVIKIVMLTSSIDRNDIETSKQYPIHGYITKPLTPEKLQNAVNDLI
jgi:CheY-like chemotaxis protein